jgi:hypothetical protein
VRTNPDIPGALQGEFAVRRVGVSHGLKERGAGQLVTVE